ITHSPRDPLPRSRRGAHIHLHATLVVAPMETGNAHEYPTIHFRDGRGRGWLGAGNRLRTDVLQANRANRIALSARIHRFRRSDPAEELPRMGLRRIAAHSQCAE